AVILGTYIFVLPQFANYGDVWAAVKDLSWRWIAILLATVALNIATFAPPWMAALPGLRFLPALTVTQASTASTYLAPGGPAVGDGRSFVRFRARAIGLLRRRWHVLTLTTLAGQLSVFLVLLASLRALGVAPTEVSAIEAFAAWSLARVIGSLPVTPGGLG